MELPSSLRQTFIPFHEWEGIGGPYTFMGNLKREFDRRHISLCPTFQDCRQMLFPISFDLDNLHWGRARGKRFMVRLDGVYYQEKHGDEYRTRNQTMKEIYRQYADLVIFQSDYCRKQCFDIFGEKPADGYRVILNGADQRLFYPADRNNVLSGRVNFVTTGNFRDASMIAPLVLALDELETSLDFRLQVVGPVAEELRSWLDRDYIIREGEKTLEETAELLRGADIFLYSHLNPPCPNSVIEAVSVGLPVAGFDSGAMAELLPWSQELLAPVSDRKLHCYEELNSHRLQKAIELSIADFERLKSLALQHAEDYPFTRCADQYIDAIAALGGQTRPATRSRAAGWVHGRLGRLAMRAARSLRLDGPIRSTAIELLASSRSQEFNGFMMDAFEKRIERLTPSEALKAAFAFDKRVYEIEGEQATEYDDGVHTKHRHTQYHRFFVESVLPTDRVLDLGCGKGELANSIAAAVPEGSVYGMDYRQTSIDRATAAFGDCKNLVFVHGDITAELQGGSFDVIVLSNVLEHVGERVELLRHCVDRFSPRQFLIRVPMYERDWRVPLMDELGVDYRLDPEHYIEYSPESFATEMERARLHIAHAEYRWGEIWSRLEPQ